VDGALWGLAHVRERYTPFGDELSSCSQGVLTS
jgi:hypothetical protein